MIDDPGLSEEDELDIFHSVRMSGGKGLFVEVFF